MAYASGRRLSNFCAARELARVMGGGEERARTWTRCVVAGWVFKNAGTLLPSSRAKRANILVNEGRRFKRSEGNVKVLTQALLLGRSKLLP